MRVRWRCQGQCGAAGSMGCNPAGRPQVRGPAALVCQQQAAPRGGAQAKECRTQREPYCTLASAAERRPETGSRCDRRAQRRPSLLVH